MRFETVQPNITWITTKNKTNKILKAISSNQKLECQLCVKDYINPTFVPFDWV